MKKILILCSYFDGQSTGSLRMRALSDSLLRSGHEVRVFTNYFAGSEQLDYVYAPQDNAIAVGQRSAVLATVYRAYRKLKLFCLGIKHHSFYKIFLGTDAASYGLDNLDAVVVSVPQPEFVDIGIALSERNGCPMVVDFRDGLTFEPLGRINWLIHYFNYRLESRAVVNSQAVVSVSDALTDYFRARYPGLSQFVTITNGFQAPEQEGPKELVNNGTGVFDSESDSINILYSGAIERSRLSIFQSLEAFERAINLLDDDSRNHLNILFIGNYSDREIAKIQIFGTVLPQVSRDEIAIAQAQADYLLLFTGPDQSVVTMKLFDYLVARKPIISVGNAPTPARILEQSGAGVQYRLSEISDIAVCLSSLQNRQKRLDTDIDEYRVDQLMDRFTQLVLESMGND
jgi:hypothetical protein